jgi:uncharacterized protein (DUF302 family)
MSTDWFTTVPSNHGPEDTMNHLQAVVHAKGLTVFARIDHAAGAAAAGLSMRPTDLLIFGNATAGTPLMQVDQTMGFDLPLKALVWQDEHGQTWVSYTNPVWLAQQHALGSEAAATIKAMTHGLDALIKAATSEP